MDESWVTLILLGLAANVVTGVAVAAADAYGDVAAASEEVSASADEPIADDSSADTKS